MSKSSKLFTYCISRTCFHYIDEINILIDITSTDGGLLNFLYRSCAMVTGTDLSNFHAGITGTDVSEYTRGQLFKTSLA